METIKNYVIDFFQSEMVQDILHKVIAFLLSFIDMEVVHDDVFIIIFAILCFISIFFIVAIFAKGPIRAVSIFFAFLMMIGAMTIFGAVRTGLLEVQFDEEKIQAMSEQARKRAEENKPPEPAPAVPQYPLHSTNVPAAAGGTHASGDLGMPQSDQIHWEIYDPYEKPQEVENIISAKQQGRGQVAEAAASEKAKPEDPPEVKAEKIRIGREIALIDSDLSHSVVFIDEHLADLDRKVQTGELDKETALLQKARWGIEREGMILDSLDEKAAVLLQANLLNDSDKANDMRKLNKQRQAANDKLAEYQSILQQTSENDGSLQAAW